MITAQAVNFAPNVGALAGEIMVALFSFDDFGHAFPAPLIYLIVAFVEGSFVTPLILGKQFALSPVMIILGLLWGIVGVFLAVPILVFVKILCETSRRLHGGKIPGEVGPSFPFR